MRIYSHLDWLSVTVPNRQLWRNLLPGIEWIPTGRGRHGYKRLYTNPVTGATAETDSDDPAMGTHITLSGAPLAEWRAVTGETDDELTRQALAMGCKVSRIDLTIDVWECTFTPELLAQDIKRGAAKIKARKWRLIDGTDNGIEGRTLDTGSPASDRRFRMYDKYAEKRIVDKAAWMRLELQLRRKYANNAYRSCAENGTVATINGHIASTLKWNNPDYIGALAGDSVQPEKVQRPDSNRQKWLKGQVARALATELHANPAFRDEFDKMVSYWLEQIDTNT